MKGLLGVTITVVLGLSFPQIGLAEFSKGDRLVVLEDNVPVMRKEDTLAKLSKGTTVIVQELTRNDHGLWVKVKGTGFPIGWVHSDYLTPAGGIIGPKWLADTFGSTLEFFKDGTLRETAKFGRVNNGTYVLRKGAELDQGSMDVEIDGIFYGKNKGVWKYSIKEDKLALEVNGIQLPHAAVTPQAVNLTSKVLGVKLNPDSEEQVVGDPEIVKTPPGVEQEYEISRMIERSVSFTEAIAVELKLDLGVEVKGRIERQVSQTFKQSETIRRNLKLDGTKTPKVKVIWIGVFRTGTATIYWNDTEKQIPFSFQVGLKPEVTVLKD